MHAPPVRPVVTVVRTAACHFCEDATAALHELNDEFPFTVVLIDATEPGGSALLREHRPAMFPLVLVDGAYFSAGRLPRGKLRKLLAARTTVGAA